MRQKILVVDDSPFMLTTIGDMLKSFSYEVTTVDNGKDACKKVESDRFDMIITDLNMPVMDGLELTKQVRTYPNCRFVPIVMLSSETDPLKVSKAKRLGISTFLRKPPNADQLKTLLQITLGKRKSQRIPIKLDVYYGEEEKITATTVNMSVGGLFLETKSPLALGTELKLEFSPPDKNDLIICQGRVAWVNRLDSPIDQTHPLGMGIEFVDLDQELEIHKLIHARLYKR